MRRKPLKENLMINCRFAEATFFVVDLKPVNDAKAALIRVQFTDAIGCVMMLEPCKQVARKTVGETP